MNAFEAFQSSRFKRNLDLKEKYVKNSNGDVAYAAFAIRGAATSDPVWKIFKFVYDTDNFLTDVLSSPPNSIFDDYATLVVYE